MNIEVPCFFMICTNQTKNECLRKNLFGHYESALPHLKSVKKGDIGFLLNVSENKLLGIFLAEDKAKLNIDPNAWNRKFPAQIKVNLVDSLQEIENATDKLKDFIELRDIPKQPNPYKVPRQSTYNPEITQKILSLFKVTADISKTIKSHPKEIGISPEFSLEDVAGLVEVKKFIHQRIIAPFEDEEIAYKLGLRIGGGMLLFGPPGTGKTLIAMSIAKNIQAKFIDISPSVIIGYPGDAEKRIENIFTAIEKQPRAVVFLDESEWILGNRDAQTSSVMQRITPVLLDQLSQLFKQRTSSIIVIAATNKPEMIDPAFLRPGRFDKIFYCRLPDKNARKEIIKMRLINRQNQLNENEIENLSESLKGYSGADIENIIEESAFSAFARRKEGKAVITKDDLEKIINEIKPSVTPNEIQKIEEWAKKRGLMR